MKQLIKQCTGSGLTVWKDETKLEEAIKHVNSLSLSLSTTIISRRDISSKRQRWIN
jgi:hypothetical protein